MPRQSGAASKQDLLRNMAVESVMTVPDMADDVVTSPTSDTITISFILRNGSRSARRLGRVPELEENLERQVTTPFQ